MNKIIYKQRNKILLALLVLGGVVSNVGVTSSTSSSSSVHSQECVTGVDNAQLGITLNPSQIRASDISGNSLPGSSGDTTTAQSTQVETNTTLTVISKQNQRCTVRNGLGGMVLAIFLEPITYQELYSEVENLILRTKGCYIKFRLIDANGKILDKDDTREAIGEITCTAQIYGKIYRNSQGRTELFARVDGITKETTTANIKEALQYMLNAYQNRPGDMQNCYKPNEYTVSTQFGGEEFPQIITEALKGDTECLPLTDTRFVSVNRQFGGQEFPQIIREVLKRDTECFSLSDTRFVFVSAGKQLQISLLRDDNGFRITDINQVQVPRYKYYILFREL
jgi:hypothetical protein